MQRTELTLLGALGALALFVGGQSVRQATPHTTASVSSGSVGSVTKGTRTTRISRSARETDRDHAHAVAVELSPARSMGRDEVRRRLASNEEGTYIGELLLEVRVAFETWQNAGIPMRFTFVRDSVGADVHVTWIDRFTDPISGKTLWSRDDRWWIVDADITLALHHKDGDPLDAQQTRAIALHEIGHLLGLDHTTDPTNIMAPRVRVRDLSLADRATAQLLYSVPAGKVR
jgi:hypothetical protein